ncbi:restriction endonuclease subunit S [Advenella sp. FME57]|uniref:restriction endonuclease subunit S n=1 Tax=Advenella sp. FME57 TaxID=2742604 RepID=UPI0018683F31|nr:restriction endonuclease subunit S [Advenella sp. FME57]
MNKHTAELLEKHFDTAFAAPDGIKKLRELILTLAMQGKLVQQDPNDTPASELLKEIAVEKLRLVQEGKIRKLNSLPPVTEEEKLYALPQGWEWVRLGTLASYKYGKTPPSKNPMYWMSNGGFPWISISDLPIRGYLTKTAKTVSPEAVSNVFKHTPTPAGSLLMSFKLSIGKTAITEIDAYHNEAIISFVGLEQRLKLWLFWVLYPVSNSGKSKKAIKGKTLNSESIGDLLIPLPPSSEQQRIVAKIDELMARCDALEELRTTHQRARLTVHRTVIKQLLNIAEPEQQQRAQAFLAENFGELYTVKENVAELRKAILQLAVMGKLVSQNPDDQPASELLMEIEAEKQRLVKEGKIKTPKPLPPVTEEEKPYPLPKGWIWVRFDAIVNIGSGVTKGRNLVGREIVNIPYLRVANVQRSYLDLSVIKDIVIPRSELEKYSLVTDDLLITEGGDWDKVGRTCIWRGEISVCVHQNHVFRARRYITSQSEVWLEKYLNSGPARAYFAAASKQTTNLASINKTQLQKLPVPLPPVSEQSRIVAKIKELMVLCESLDQQIDAATSKQAELLNVLIHEQSKGLVKEKHRQESLSPAQVIDLATYRASIGCYALTKLANARYFGRTAAAKVMYLAQAHIGLELDLKPEREAAGPLDTWIYDFERYGRGKRWFEVNEKTLANGKKKTEYRCLSALSEPAAQAEALMSPSQKSEFDRLIYALADKTTEEVEIIATLFAVWNDFLIDGAQPTDEQIIFDVRENWHERKARFTPTELSQWLAWLRRENIVPQGLPPRTVQQSRLGFD